MIGEQIKTLRLARKITQVELAQSLEVTKQTVSNWENNNILPSVEMLRKIATYFSCSTDFLLELDTRNPFIDTSDLTLRQTVILQEIAQEFRSSNAKELQ